MAWVLPSKPDKYGTYWLNGPREAPAIIRSKKRVWNEESNQFDVIDQPHYFATTRDGPITEGDGLKRFKSPTDALAAIQKAASP